MNFYAHTAARADGTSDPDPTNWQALYTGDAMRPGHLDAVADLAAKFAEAFHAADWARLAGLWHDLGKYSVEFQARLRAAGGADAHLEERPEIAKRVNHSTAGATHAVSLQDPISGPILAYLIAGHHAGLPDGDTAERSSLAVRMSEPIPTWRPHAPTELLSPQVLRPPVWLRPSSDATESFGFRVAFFARMLFSALVDADFLDTESFMNAPQAAMRRTIWPDMATLETCLEAYYAQKFGPADTEVKRWREVVRASCLARAGDKPGIFSLTVPTGGGKTLASLAFALRHAKQHGLTRIIYVVPFTSIIEQNADVFRAVFSPLGDDIVVEHHSNLDPDDASMTATARLACENWDAPVIVTTSVQFYESLFAARTSRCRKLHHIARSVVILDEAQALPVRLLHPCIAALRELAAGYGASVVLCTATQPAVIVRDNFPIGLPEPRQIVTQPERIHQALRRTQVIPLSKRTDAELVSRLKQHPQALCIVNTRTHARTLFEQLGQDCTNLHLSALMVAAHRSELIATIRDRLENRVPCRVISTQLVEAGVDLDFPVVYRALAGIDSIAQAAGRCNREGKLGELGRVFVFEPEKPAPPELQLAAKTAAEILRLHADEPLSLNAIEQFFRLYFWKRTDEWDAEKVMECFPLPPNDPRLLRFRTAAERFRLIKQVYEPIVVAPSWDTRATALVEELHRTNAIGAPPPAMIHRRLQRYTVQVPPHVLIRHLGNAVVKLHDQFNVVVHPAQHYSRTLGLTLDNDSPEGGGYYS
jgi:CRISPR-associated endonuclease/helicase Cas3